MILLSPDAVNDVERLRSFLDQNNPSAAQRALLSIWMAVDRLQEPGLGMPTADVDIRQFGRPVRYIRLHCSLRVFAARYPDHADMARPGRAALIPHFFSSASLTLPLTNAAARR